MASSLDYTEKLAIINVRVFDGQHFSEPRTVAIANGIIVETDDAIGAKVIDGNEQFLLPGLIDAHIHLKDKSTLRQMAEYGITTGLDMATWPPSKLDPLRGCLGLTDIRSPGLPATCSGSIHSHILPIPQNGFVASPEDAAQFVQDRIMEGADYIKVIADVPGPDQPTLNALVAEAHKHKMLVVAHASSFTPFAMAQEAEADIITHTPRDKALDGENIARMVSSKCVSVPTLAMMEGVMKRPKLKAILRLMLSPAAFLAVIKAKRNNPHGGGQRYENARHSVKAMYDAGVPILAGTDANAEPHAPFDLFHGESLHHELELLVDAGLSTIDTLHAATSLPAKHFGLNDRGIIEVGKRADIILLARDPIQDIRATRSIQRIWCGGIEVQKSLKLA
ncbi:hypothetical protein V492_05909 [Pseudogymnoascus sp. VKM F-4246]|nr:hypothetical protein V492_05909 [Pseudogymnoascus sp. VKM F-4246]